MKKILIYFLITFQSFCLSTDSWEGIGDADKGLGNLLYTLNLLSFWASQNTARNSSTEDSTDTLVTRTYCQNEICFVKYWITDRNDDKSTGNNDTRANPDETILINFRMVNQTDEDIKGQFTAILSAESSKVSILEGSKIIKGGGIDQDEYRPDRYSGNSYDLDTDNQFRIKINNDASGIIPFNLFLSNGSKTYKENLNLIIYPNNKGVYVIRWENEDYKFSGYRDIHIGDDFHGMFNMSDLNNQSLGIIGNWDEKLQGGENVRFNLRLRNFEETGQAVNSVNISVSGAPVEITQPTNSAAYGTIPSGNIGRWLNNDANARVSNSWTLSIPSSVAPYTPLRFTANILVGATTYTDHFELSTQPVE